MPKVISAQERTLTNTDTVTVESQHDKTTYKVKRFESSSSGNAIAAVIDKKLRIHSYNLQAQGTVTVTFKNASGGAELGVNWKLEDREGVATAFCPEPAFWFETGEGQPLYVLLSASVTVCIEFIYSEV